MNCVVVGYGFSGKSFHCYLIRHATNTLRLYGVVARKKEMREQATKDLGQDVQTWPTLEDALKDPQVNIVVVASSNDTHAQLALQALRMKKHVVVEKPMALTVADAEEMIKVAEENKVLLTVFQNRRWDGDFLTVQKLLRENKLGPKIHMIEVFWCKYGVPINKPWKMAPTKQGGGRFWDFSAHMLDQILLLLHPARVTHVHCIISYACPDTPLTDSHALLTLTFNTGVHAVVHTSSRYLFDKPRWLLCGDTGTYIKHGVDPQEAAMIGGAIEKAPQDVEGVMCTEGGKVLVETVKGEWVRFYENVAEAVEGKRELLVKGVEVLRFTKVMEAALRSAEKGEVVVTDI